MKRDSVSLNTVNMNIQQLKYFLDLASTLSFSRTADNFHISQVAVTHQVQNLESKLGVKLFSRTKRHVDLTYAGRVFINEAQRLIGKIEEAVDKTRAAALGFSGAVTVGFTTGVTHTSVIDFLRNVKKSMPDICLTYRRDTNRSLEQGLKDSTYDLVFEFLTEHEARVYECENQLEMEHIPLCVLLPGDHPLAKKETLTWEVLRSEHLITYNKTVGELAIQSDMVLSGGRGLPDIEMLLLSVAMEDGITVLPKFIAQCVPTTLPLTFVPMTGDDSALALVARWNKDSRNQATLKVVRALENFIGK